MENLLREYLELNYVQESKNVIVLINLIIIYV